MDQYNYFRCISDFFFVLSVFLLKERKNADEEPYLDYLSKGIRIKVGAITTAVIGVLFVGVLYYFVFITQDLIQTELICFAAVFFAISLFNFLVLKPRP